MAVCEKCEGAGVTLSPLDGGAEPCPACQPHMAPADPWAELADKWAKMRSVPSWARVIISQQAEILRRLGVG